MAQTKQQIQAILSAAGTGPKHRFGQNFMIDQNLVRVIADAGHVSPDDTVIEVGPGTGTLTEELLSRGARVVAVEIDRELARGLRERFASESRFELIEGDALASKHRLNPEILQRISAKPQAAKLVANLPYNIASPLVVELLHAGVGLLAFTVQKEVADRLEAAAGTEAYGPLSVVVQLLGKVEVLRKLPPQAFWPAPSVDSALVQITRSPDASDEAARLQHRERERFIHNIFNYRRKTLRKAIAQAGYDASQILERTGFDGQQRPEQLTPLQFAEMFAASRQPDRLRPTTG